MFARGRKFAVPSIKENHIYSNVVSAIESICAISCQRRSRLRQRKARNCWRIGTNEQIGGNRK
jgi:hypothetical protein